MIHSSRAATRIQHRFTRTFEKLEKFGSYGFNKSHSVAYAYVSYQMAYMKTHFPVEFICAVLYAKKGNQSDVMRFIYEAQESGIPVLPPDVNRSQADFTVEDVKDPDGTTKGAIRFGLTAVKGVGTTAIALVLKAREDGPFESVADFLARIDKQKVNRKVVESLIKAGAFDAFGHTRRSLAEGINQLFDAAARLSEDRESGQGGLFDLSEDTSVKTVSGPPPLPEWPQREKLALERDALGYYVTGHPIHEYRDSLAKFDVLRLSDMDETMSGKNVGVAGMVLTVEEKFPRRPAIRWPSCRSTTEPGQLNAAFLQALPQVGMRRTAPNHSSFPGDLMSRQTSRPKSQGIACCATEFKDWTMPGVC